MRAILCENINFSINESCFEYSFKKGFLTENINISSTTHFFWISYIYVGYQRFAEKEAFFWSLWKSYIFENIKIQTKKTFLWSLWKNCFLSKCPKLSTFREKGSYFKSLLKYSFFAHIPDHFKKVVFCSYIRKYKY